MLKKREKFWIYLNFENKKRLRSHFYLLPLVMVAIFAVGFFFIQSDKQRNIKEILQNDAWTEQQKIIEAQRDTFDENDNQIKGYLTKLLGFTALQNDALQKEDGTSYLDSEWNKRKMYTKVKNEYPQILENYSLESGLKIPNEFIAQLRASHTIYDIPTTSTTAPASALNFTKFFSGQQSYLYL